jgi:hypothetical protein
MTRLFYMAGESGLRQRGRRFAPVFDVRAEARTFLRTVPSFLEADAVQRWFLGAKKKSPADAGLCFAYSLSVAN